MKLSDQKNNNDYSDDRRLAAIMFTDMVGYSALTQKNENLAIELLELHRDILRPIFSKHKGNEIESIGDAFFVEFSSTVAAVNCAVEIQTVLHERNMICEESRKILLRIGIHVGDVLHRGDRVHGDGVNIAARLEPLSIPGGICLSEDVARQVMNKIEYHVQNVGVKKLKNIKNPMKIYCIAFPWLIDQKKINENKFKALFDGKKYAAIIVFSIILILTLIFWKSLIDSPIGMNNSRLAVLPFVNIGNSEENEYFADGMTEELISRLAKIKDLNVIARTSVMKYKNSNTDIEEIGSELDVNIIIEGSIRKISRNARISIKLIDVNTQEYIWNEDFNKEVKDIFNVQSEIALKIADELKLKLLSSEIEQVEKQFSTNEAAQKSYLLGKYNFNRRTNESISNALVHFQNAVELDNTYALAHVGIADCYTLLGGAGYGEYSRDDVIQIANNSIKTALSIDDELAEAYSTLAYMKFRLEWDWSGAEKNFLHSIDLKPSNAEAHERYALFLALHRRFDEARIHMKRAYELNPLSKSVMTGIGRIEHFDGNYEKAIRHYENILFDDPNYAEAVFARGLSYSQLNKFDFAIRDLKLASQLSNERVMVVTALGLTYARANQIDSTKMIYNKIVERAKKSNISPFYFALLEWTFTDKEKSIDKFYQAYQNRFGIMVYLNVSPLYDQSLRKEPRFIKLLELMGFDP